MARSLTPIRALLMRNQARDENGCWNWTGHLYPKGYGQFHIRGRVVYAHRASYVEFKGEIPEGLVLDHLCRNRKCVNPDHLEAVTQLENVRRSPLRIRTACEKGHLYTQDNTYFDKHGWKHCRTCNRDSKRQKYQMKNPIKTNSPEEIRNVQD